MELNKEERDILIATLEKVTDDFEDFDYMDFPNEVATIKNILKKLKEESDLSEHK